MLGSDGRQSMAKYCYTDYLETSPRNHDCELVAANVIVRPYDGTIYYRCQPAKWRAAHENWSWAYSDDKSVPQPMPEAHCMFLDPLGYGCVELGETRQGMIRRAMRSSVIARLDGWDREMRRSVSGMKRLARIVESTVAQKMNGEDLGAAPYLACLYAGI